MYENCHDIKLLHLEITKTSKKMLHILSLDEKLKALTRIYNNNNNFSFLSNSIWILDRSANLFVLVD